MIPHLPYELVYALKAFFTEITESKATIELDSLPGVCKDSVFIISKKKTVLLIFTMYILINFFMQGPVIKQIDWILDHVYTHKV